MSTLTPDIERCLAKIHSAVNDGTLDRDTVNSELKKLHDFLIDAPHEQPAQPDEAVAVEDVADVGEAPHPHKKPRKKR